MSVEIKFLFDFGSPNAYLSHLIIPDVEKRTGEKFTYVPILLGGIFKMTGNVSPFVTLQGIKNKPEYVHLETTRFVKKHNITDFQHNPHFPVNTLQVMRGAIVAERSGFLKEYVNTMYYNMWAAPKKLDDPEVIKSVLLEAKLPADDIMNGIQDPDVKQQLLVNTENAVEKGVFGSPSFLVGTELYFGKDRLRDVEEEIEMQKE